MKTLTTYVAISVRTLEILTRTIGRPDRAVIAAGLLVARCDADQRWLFTLRSRAGTSEQHLLRWVVNHIPRRAIAVCWNLETGAIQPLMDVASRIPSTATVPALGRLFGLARGAVELTATPVAWHRTSLADAATDAAIYAPCICPADDLDDWLIGIPDRLRADLADEALASWRLFLRSAGHAGLSAEEATDRWLLHRRDRLGAVRREDPG